MFWRGISESDLVEKQKMLCLKMQRFGPVDIDKNTLHLVNDKMEIFKDAFGEFMLGIELLLREDSCSCR